MKCILHATCVNDAFSTFRRERCSHCHQPTFFAEQVANSNMFPGPLPLLLFCSARFLIDDLRGVSNPGTVIFLCLTAAATLSIQLFCTNSLILVIDAGYCPGDSGFDCVCKDEEVESKSRGATKHKGIHAYVYSKLSLLSKLVHFHFLLPFCG